MPARAGGQAVTGAECSRRRARDGVIPFGQRHSIGLYGDPGRAIRSRLSMPREGGLMADIVCTVPGCDAEAVLVLNGHPICRPHCEEFAKRAEVLDAPP